MRNQLSDKFDEVEQDYLGYHSFYGSLLSAGDTDSSSDSCWFDSFKTGAELPDLSQKLLYDEPQLVSTLFGKVFTVRLSLELKSKIATRFVEENRTIIDKELLTKKLLQMLSEADLARTLHQQLSELARRNRKTREEMAEMFVRLSGDMQALRQQLAAAKPYLATSKTTSQFFTEWTHAEDTALFQSTDSNDYAVLLKTKGATELEKRRLFLLGGC